MADLAASDVTVTMVRKDKMRKTRMNLVTIAFGDGAKTYPANGVPMPALSSRKFGLEREMDLQFLEVPQDGYVYKYDRTNRTIRMYQSAGFTPAVSAITAGTPAGSVAAPTFTGSALAAHDHDIKVIGNAPGGIDEPLGVEGTDTLAKDAATDRTIVGANSATKGGVVGITAGTPAGTCSAPAFTGSPLATHNHTGVAVAAAVLVELGNVIVAAKAFRAMAIGI